MKKYMDSKKKIGIVTFHSAQNYGANLQAYALQKYINDNIGESEIIDFNPFKKPKHSLVRKAYQIKYLKELLTPNIDKTIDEKKHSFHSKKNTIHYPINNFIQMTFVKTIC